MLKRSWEPKSMYKKKNNAIGIIMLGFKICNRAVVSKTYRYRNVNQWNRVGDQDILTYMVVLFLVPEKFPHSFQ